MDILDHSDKCNQYSDATVKVLKEVVTQTVDLYPLDCAFMSPLITIPECIEMGKDSYLLGFIDALQSAIQLRDSLEDKDKMMKGLCILRGIQADKLLVLLEKK